MKLSDLRDRASGGIKVSKRELRVIKRQDNIVDFQYTPTSIVNVLGHIMRLPRLLNRKITEENYFWLVHPEMMVGIANSLTSDYVFYPDFTGKRKIFGLSIIDADDCKMNEVILKEKRAISIMMPTDYYGINVVLA